MHTFTKDQFFFLMKQISKLVCFRFQIYKITIATDPFTQALNFHSVVYSRTNVSSGRP